jgi:hypothetical protein
MGGEISGTFKGTGPSFVQNKCENMVNVTGLNSGGQIVASTSAFLK